MGLLDYFKRKSVEKRVSYIMTQDGNITVVSDGKTTQVSPAHPNHAQIVAALQGGRMEGLDDLIDVPAAINRKFADVEVDEFGHVFYKGNQIGGSVATRIMEFVRDGQDVAPLALFLSNLMKNPSRRAIEELYSFLENGNMPITPDGCFMAYKGVASNFLDKHSRSFDNSPGQVLEMERREVDDDCTRTCSYGFHVGSHSYASNWAGGDGKLVLVKVNPADAVSVPKEHGSEKLRVCRYEVIEEATPLPGQEPHRQAWEPLEGHVYGDESTDFDLDDEEPEEEYCDECGESWCEGECQDEVFDCDYCEDEGDVDGCMYCGKVEEEEIVPDPTPPTMIEPRTGRARGEGGRFLPKNPKK